MSVAYLACPYSDVDPKVKKLRLMIVTQIAYDLFKQGIYVYSPLTHNVPIDNLGLDGNWETWKNFDYEMVSRCDKLIVLQLPGWEESKGVKAEIQYAKDLGIPIEWLPVSTEKVEQAINKCI